MSGMSPSGLSSLTLFLLALLDQSIRTLSFYVYKAISVV